MKELGLYIHIPFCRSKCAYCAFYSLAGGRERFDRYRDVLLRQLEREGTGAEDAVVTSVYYGGGTPSWFGCERLAELQETVRRSFRLSGDCEVTVEANPDSIDPAGAERLKRAGFNRVSLGVQSADDTLLRRAGRPHTFARAAEAVRELRGAGFDNLSVDLIYGLPGETPELWQRSIEAVLALEPEHLSAYGLTVEEGTAFFRHRERYSFPDEDRQADDYLLLCDRLRRAGFEHYEISSFARPGRASRHNTKYWRLTEYLGFGPGAYSDYRGERFGYAAELEDYLEQGEKGAVPRIQVERPDRDERLREYLMLGLRLSDGISRREFERRGGTCWDRVERALSVLLPHGLTERTEDGFRLTERGWLVSNPILAELTDLI